MTSKFGRGFIINLTHLARQFHLPPEQAWYGAQDFMVEMIIPDHFAGTDVEVLAKELRQKVMWHQPGGPVDKEMYLTVRKLIDRLLVAIDTQLGIPDPDIGQFR